MARIIKRTQRTISNTTTAAMDITDDLVNGTTDTVKGAVRGGRYIIDTALETGAMLPSAKTLGATIFNAIKDTFTASEEEAALYAKMDAMEVKLELKELELEMAKREKEIEALLAEEE